MAPRANSSAVPPASAVTVGEGLSIPAANRITIDRNKRGYPDYIKEADTYSAQAKAKSSGNDYEEAARLMEAAAGVMAHAKSIFWQLERACEKLNSLENQYLTFAAQYRQKAANRSAERGLMPATPGTGVSAVAINTTAVATSGSEAPNKTLVAEKPRVHWDDVIGVDSAKQAVREAVDVPLRFPQLFAQLKLRPWSGILLYGPPGTGKTMLAKAAAYETQCAFFNVKGSDIFSCLVGEGEKHVAALFARAQACKPAIVFLDECDSLLRARTDRSEESSNRIKTEFFTAMDGFAETKGVLVIAATNCYDQLDDAALRRFGKRIFVDIPDAAGRCAIFARKLKDLPCTCTFSDYQDLAARTAGYTGSDIDKVLTEAKYAALRRITGATYFRKDGRGVWIPTAPTHPQAMQLTGDTTLENFDTPIHRNDILAALAVTPAVVSQEKLRAYRSQYEATQTQ